MSLMDLDLVSGRFTSYVELEPRVAMVKKNMRISKTLAKSRGS
jgi:hypothetical protein